MNQQKIKLYHYIHCPFCLRVRMVLGYFSIEHESIVVAYDDEILPIHLAGKKMLPIVVGAKREPMNESLDIIREIDQQDLLNFTFYLDKQNEIETLLSSIGKIVHPLAGPYWAYGPEFDDRSRKYFVNKKESKRGPFNELVLNQSTYLGELEKLFADLEAKLKPFYHSEVMTVVDILLASHLWGLYIVPELQIQKKIHSYLQKIKANTHFNYHHDIWVNNNYYEKLRSTGK